MLMGIQHLQNQIKMNEDNMNNISHKNQTLDKQKQGTFQL